MMTNWRFFKYVFSAINRQNSNLKKALTQIFFLEIFFLKNYIPNIITSKKKSKSHAICLTGGCLPRMTWLGYPSRVKFADNKRTSCSMRRRA